MKSLWKILPAGLLALAMIVAVGCSGQQQMMQQDQADSSAVDSSAAMSAEDSASVAAEQARQDSIDTAREAERRRLEAERAEAERRRQEQARAASEAKQSLQTIYFGFDASSISAEAAEKLQANADILREYADWKVVIEGHTDERGSTEYNLALGERRADRVRQYYVNLGIEESRLEMISYGEERPAVEGSGEEAWSQNRRAVTVAR